jgi:hypothetical protein
MPSEEGPRPEGARDRSRLTNVSGLASLQDAGSLLRRDFQGLRFACPWLPSCIPDGMQGRGEFLRKDRRFD